MKRFLWFVLGLVSMTALLVSGYGCATVNKDDTCNLIMSLNYDDSAQTVVETGWVPQDDEGSRWEYWSRRGNTTVVVAGCYLTDISITGEKWEGIYYWGSADFNDGRPPMGTFDRLCDCVEWVDHMKDGDYYL